MAFSIIKSSLNTIVVTASINPLTVTIKKANSDYTLTTLIENVSIAATKTFIYTYITDGVYIVSVTELSNITTYSDMNIETITNHLTDDVKNVIVNPFDNKSSIQSHYDFINLITLGLQFFGNTDYILGEFTEQEGVLLHTTLQPLQDSFTRVSKYIETNNLIATN